MALIILEDPNPHYNVISHKSPENTVDSMCYVSSDDRYHVHNTTISELAKVYTDNFFSEFNTVKTKKVHSGLLQPGVKMIGDNYLIFERPPTFKNVFYIGTDKANVPDEFLGIEDAQNIFRIPIPWQLYFVKFNNDMYTYEVRMYFMNNSLVSLDQVLSLPPLPNFFTNGLLCSPSMDNMDDVDRYSKDASGIMACAYDWVWNSGTNHDLTESCLSASSQIEHSSGLFKNRDKSEVDAKFISKNFNSYAATVSQVNYLLSCWEEFSLHDVCSMTWPNISGDSKNFNRVNYTEHYSYYDYLNEYLIDYLNIEQEDVEDIVENEGYDSNDYFMWLTHNNKIDFSSINRYPEYRYPEVMPDLIDGINRELKGPLHNLLRDVAAHQSLTL